MLKVIPFIVAGLAAALLCVGCLGSGGLKVPDKSREPDSVFSEYAEKKGLPALAVAVIKNNQPVYTRAQGARKQGDATPVEPGDAFHIGSNTKAMTALLAGMLVDEGKIQWTSTIAEVLGSKIAYKPEYGQLDLERLLSHTSGVPADLPNASWNSFFKLDSATWQQPEKERSSERLRMAEAALALKPASKPGTAYLYSNFNYVIAGLMLEVVTGQSWEALLGGRLFAPLGMASAGFGPPASPGRVDAPWGHDPKPVAPGPMADNPPALGPAGTAHANLADLEAYLKLYLSGGLGPDGSRLISEESLENIYTARLNNYGLGWVNLGSATAPVLVHDGSNTSFYSSFVIIPSAGFGVIVLANRGDAQASKAVMELREYLVARFIE